MDKLNEIIARLISLHIDWEIRHDANKKATVEETIKHLDALYEELMDSSERLSVEGMKAIVRIESTGKVYDVT